MKKGHRVEAAKLSIGQFFVGQVLRNDRQNLTAKAARTGNENDTDVTSAYSLINSSFDVLTQTTAVHVLIS